MVVVGGGCTGDGVKGVRVSEGGMRGNEALEKT